MSKPVVAFAFSCCLACAARNDLDVDGAAGGAACDYDPGRGATVRLHEAPPYKSEYANNLIVRDCHAYWTAVGEAGGNILSAPADGGGLIEHATDIRDLGDIAIGAETLYFEERNAIHRVPLDGTMEPELLVVTPHMLPIRPVLLADDLGVYSAGWEDMLWIRITPNLVVPSRVPLPQVSQVVQHGDFVYASGVPGVFELHKPQSAAQLLGPTEWSASQMAVDDERIYLAAAGRITTMPIGGGAESTLFEGLPAIMDMEVDDRFIYFTVFGSLEPTQSGAVFALPLSGGDPMRLATDDGVTRIALDEHSVFWLSDAGLSRRAKPR